MLAGGSEPHGRSGGGVFWEVGCTKYKIGNGKERPQVTVQLGRPNSEPQKAFFASQCKYTCYGGARGGGKSWAVRTKAVGGALTYAGIKILIIRRTYKDLENSLIDPIKAMVPQGVGEYNASLYRMTFLNGSYIKFGHLSGYGAAVSGEYQGQEYDWIFMDEATQFTEAEFRGLAACLRGVNDIPKRFYLTCNPGGIGHAWVKRLFVERRFQEREDPRDYVFIKATVDDNKDLMEASPDYVAALELLPDDIRAAHRYGDWDALAGQYFGEFRRELHVVQDFVVPDEWNHYRVFDYGLDMFACYWIAVDFSGRVWVYREFCQSGLLVSEAAQAMRDLTPDHERILFTIAPPDMWSTLKDTGKTMAQLFAESGLPVVKANNSRVAGWMAVKELLKPMADGKPGLLVFNTCKGIIDDLMAIQHDDKNPSDCAKEPHDITHAPDALRYYAQLRTLKPEQAPVVDEEEHEESYSDYMTGGEADSSYLNF